MRLYSFSGAPDSDPTSGPQTAARRKHRRPGRTGFSLIELVIAMAVLAIALLALMSSIFSSSRLVDTSRERTLAYEAARSKIEEMRNFTHCLTFNNIYNYYRVNPNNIAAVAGLNPIFVAGVEQPELSITFPMSGANLTEAPADAILATSLGMPKDLNRDGDATDVGGTGAADDLNTNYKLLPVLITLRWKSAGGSSQTLDVTTFISEK